MSAVQLERESKFEVLRGRLASVATIDLYSLAVRGVLFLAFFGNTLDLEYPRNTVGINVQAIVKAMLAMLAVVLGTIGWWRYPVVRTLLRSPIGILSMLLGGLFFAAVPGSLSPTTSMMGAIGFAGYLLLVLTGLALVGADRLWQEAWGALLIYIVLCWLAFYFLPEYGVLMEEAGAHSHVVRMNGLGHPNALGRSASLFTLLTLVAFRRGKVSWWWAGLFMVIGVVTLWGSFSRTAMLACLVSGLVLFNDWFRSRAALIGMPLGVAVALMTLIYVDARYGLDRVVDRVLVGTSKTGDAEEITSATGRTAIWAKSWELIKQRPILGYGSGTSPMLLEDYSSHTHNILLNPCLSVGLGGGMVVMIWLLLNLGWALTFRYLSVTAVVVFILVSGLTENTILPTFPESNTLAWLIASFIPYHLQVDVASPQ